MENLVEFKKLHTFYRDKRIFITGHTGFKGSWLSACLHKLGAVVKGYSLTPEYENGLFNLLEPQGIFTNVIADIRDKARLEFEITSFNPDLIFHLAAQPIVRRSYKKPAETFDINVIGTANLLESLIELPTKCAAVIVTTDKVYENKEEDILYKENDTLGGYDPYSSSKACAEIVINSFRKSFFNLKNLNKHQKSLVSARAGNVIGGGDWSEDRLIPDVVRAIKDDRTVEIRNPDSIRPWQHVLEPLTAYLIMGKAVYEDPHSYSDSYNIGPNPEDHLSVKDLLKYIFNYWGKGNWHGLSNSEKPHEAGILKLDISLIEKDLGWKPKLNSEKAIEWTIDWYKCPAENQVNYTYKQISDYFKL